MSEENSNDATDPRLGLLLDGIVRLAAGDLNTRIEISDARDEIDAVIMGTNLLAEDLQIIYEELEQRVAARTRQLHEAHREMQHMAMTDPLTGLHNRSAFSAALGEAQDRGPNGSQRPAILLMDMNGFKGVNDSWATPSGTRCWKRWPTASALQSARRTWWPAWAATNSRFCCRT